jgi:all-trans-8'-apo-beta-carotenal 15,15'-oxygenase
VGPDKYAHPFDGDGLLLSLALKGGRAFARAAFVQTPERAAEQAAGRVAHRNTFGTQRAGGAGANFGDVKQKNVANTAVLFWGGRLLALWEALQPYRLDPRTLATRGVDTLDGLLREGLPFASGLAPLDALLRALGTGLGGDALSAHPHVCGATGNLVTFSYAIRLNPALPPEGPLQTVLTVLEFAPGSLTPLSRRDVPLRGYGFVHDFAFTEKWYVIFQNPVDLDIAPFALGQRCPGECLSFQEQRPTRALLVPRGAARAGEPIRAAELPLPSWFVFHHANAHDDAATGDVVVDSVHMAGLYLGIAAQGQDFRDADFESSPRYELWRVRVPPGAAEGTGALASATRLSPRLAEFPSVAPARFGRKARYIYASVGTHPTRVQPLQGWAKFDLAGVDAAPGAHVPALSWEPGPRFFAGEPQFVPRPGGAAEDDGWLCGWLFDAERRVSAFAVLDARDMRQLAMLRLRHAVPYGLHGTFVDEYFGP